MDKDIFSSHVAFTEKDKRDSCWQLIHVLPSYDRDQINIRFKKKKKKKKKLFQF